MTRWISFPAVVLWGVALGSAVAQEVPFTGVVVDEAVPIHAGAGRSFYVVGELTVGSEVKVEEVVFGWYKIAPPQGTYSYVSQAFVDADSEEKLGKVNIGRAAVRAASINGAVESYRRQIDLIKGDVVEIVGEENSFYKIVPPKNAYVFLPPGSVRASADDGGGLAAKALAGVPGQASPLKDNAQSVALNGADTTARDAQSDTAAGADLSVVGGTSGQIEANFTLAPVSQALKDAEKQLIEAQRLPLEQQPTPELLASYRSLAQQESLSIVDKHIILMRIAQLKRNVAITETLREIGLAREADATAQIKEVTIELSRRLKAGQRYAVQGRFVASGVYNGKTMPRLYRIAAPTNDRTVAYVKLSSNTKPGPFIGRHVGVVGKSKFDPSVGLEVIEADQIDLVAVTAAR